LGFGILSTVAFFRSEKGMQAVKRDTEEILVRITTESSCLSVIDDATRLIETDDTTLLYIYASGLKAFEGKEYERAVRCFRAAKEYTPDTTVMITMLNLIGLTQHKSGRFKEAIGTWKEMIDLSEKNESVEAMNAALNNTILAYQSLRNKEKALEFQLRLLVFKGEIDHPQLTGGIDTLEYREAYLDLIETQQLVPLPPGLLPALGGADGSPLNPRYVKFYELAKDAYVRRDYEQAARYFRMAAQADIKYGSGILAVYRLEDAGLSLLEAHKYCEARKTFEMMFEVATSIYWKEPRVTALSYAGIACWEYGDTLSAWYFYRRALKILERIKDKRVEHIISQAILLHKIGIIYQTWGKPMKALEYYELARNAAVGTGSSSREIKANQLLNIGVEYVESGYLTQALEYLVKARAEFMEMGNNEMVSNCNLMILYVLERLEEAGED
jgi:tetratricopeptide (TPR) repeat protein